MASKFVRRDFLIKDLAVSVGTGGRGTTWLPTPDGKTPPSPISPVAAVTTQLDLIEAVRRTVDHAVKTKDYGGVAAAFVPGAAAGDPVIRSAIQEIGTAVVASAVFAAFGTGRAGYPNPECAGDSVETVPPTFTHVIHYATAAHKVTELPRLRKQLAIVMSYLDKVAETHTAHPAELDAMRTEIEKAPQVAPAFA